MPHGWSRWFRWPRSLRGRWLSLAVLAAVAGGAGAWLALRGGAAKHAPLLVIGIDGGEWRVVHRMWRDGELPNLRRLADRGTTATLETAYNASPVIWTTIATGVTPAEHGITDFVVPSPHGDVPISSMVRRVPALWTMLTQAHRRVAVLGWGGSWPADGGRRRRRGQRSRADAPGRPRLSRGLPAQARRRRRAGPHLPLVRDERGAGAARRRHGRRGTAPGAGRPRSRAALLPHLRHRLSSSLEGIRSRPERRASARRQPGAAHLSRDRRRDRRGLARGPRRPGRARHLGSRVPRRPPGRADHGVEPRRTPGPAGIPVARRPGAGARTLAALHLRQPDPPAQEAGAGLAGGPGTR